MLLWILLLLGGDALLWVLLHLFRIRYPEQIFVACSQKLGFNLFSSVNKNNRESSVKQIKTQRKKSSNNILLVVVHLLHHLIQVVLIDDRLHGRRQQLQQ